MRVTAGSVARATCPTQKAQETREGRGMMLLVATELMAAAEVARYLRVSRQRVHVLTRTFPDFPQPIADLSVGRVWRAEDIAAWAERHGRAPNSP